MLVSEEDNSHVVVDIDNGCHRSSVGGGGDGGNEGCSDTVDRSDEEPSCSHESGPEIEGVSEKNRGSSASECSVELDLESVVLEAEPDVKVHLGTVKRDCRICHLSMDMNITNHESDTPIELGCSCKDDLAAAHKQCAEAWFKIKGNKNCEICGSIACNVAASAVEVEMTEQWNEANAATMVPPPNGPAPPAETRNFWKGHRFLNFLLACMVFAFVISWLFHFNVPS